MMKSNGFGRSMNENDSAFPVACSRAYAEDSEESQDRNMVGHSVPKE